MDQCQGNRFRYETVSNEYDIPPREIESCFSEELDFGTAGMRATMGVGSARMNIYTVATAAYAMGEMLKEKHEGKGSKNRYFVRFT